eukprot:scaffold7250_cov131-Cylindrotheca_fusiformis.AAC.5
MKENGDKEGVVQDEEAPPPMDLTDVDHGLTDDQVAKSLEEHGTNEIPVPETPLYMIFVRQFTGFLPLLIELAAILAIAVEDFVDFGIILGILVINACLGFREEYHAKKALEELSNKIDSEISVRRNGEVNNISAKEIVPGDIILLVGGTIVPADVKWRKGDKMQIDTAALTGEPIPRKYPCDEYGDTILSGTTVVAGECYAQVMLTGTNTEIGQAQADVLKDKSIVVVSVFQEKIFTVVKVLTSASFAMVIAVLLVDGLAYAGFKSDVRESILDALSIMIASIPVALPLVLQVNLALGASFLAKEHNAIVTSIPALQDIASMSMLCSDKTGTLTTANMSIITDRIFASEGFTEAEVILYAFLCSNADKKDDPIDRAIVKAFNESKYKDSADEYEQTEIIGFNPNVKRVVAFVKHGEETYTIAKGLPAKIMDTAAGSKDDHELQWKVQGIDNEEFIKSVEKTDSGLSNAGYKTIAVAVCKGNAREMKNPVWEFAGLMPMLDPPRKDTRATIESLHHANISVKMITGDHVNVGKETARLIGLGTDIRSGEEIRNAHNQDKKRLIWEADGFASVLPSDKREAVLILRNEWGLVTGMTGDGVNDAPALSAAQVGIAVAGATDAAKNAADLILTEHGLSPIYGAVLESRRIFVRIKSYVVYRVAASIILVLTLSIVLFATGCAVDSLLVIILALLNDVSMIPGTTAFSNRLDIDFDLLDLTFVFRAVAYDNAQATARPQLPNARKLVLMSIFYGVLQTIGNLIFIFSLDDSGVEYPISLDECSDQTKGFIWFQLVLVTELMIFSVRAPAFFLRGAPSIWLVISVLLTCLIGAFIAVYASDLEWMNVLWIVIFNLGMLVLSDILKRWMRIAIDDVPGEVIATDDLLDVPPIEKSDVQKHLAKKMRYHVHNESLLPPEDRHHVVRVRQRSDLSDGFISRKHEAMLSGSTR